VRSVAAGSDDSGLAERVGLSKPGVSVDAGGWRMESVCHWREAGRTRRAGTAGFGWSAWPAYGQARPDQANRWGGVQLDLREGTVHDAMRGK
jgi:hypothetical protein